MKAKTTGDTPAKRRVLVFMLAPPLPAVAGGDIYAVNALLPFIDKIDFHLFCFVGDAAAERKIHEHANLYARVFRSVHTERRPKQPFEMSRWRRLRRLLWCTWLNLPFVDASYYSAAGVHAARRLVRKYGIDALEINSAHLGFFAKFIRLPALLVGHNIEADLFPFWIPSGMHGLRLRVLTWVAKRSRKAAHGLEIENTFGFSAMTFISRQDMARVTAAVPKFYLPLYFKKTPVPYADKPVDAFNVLWMGGFGWYPNAEGVTWFCNEVMPHLRDRLNQSQINLHFCGNHPPVALSEQHDGKHVFVHGFVNDIDAMLAKAHLLMVPLRSGSGIRVKIVEAMSAGIPVLSTTKGCDGLGVRADIDIIIRDDPAAFAQAIVDAAADRQKMAQLAQAGLQFIAEYHSEAASLAAKTQAYRAIGVLP